MNALVGNVWSATCHRNVSMESENRLNISMKIRKNHARLACIAMLLLRSKPSLNERIFTILQIMGQFNSPLGLSRHYVNIQCSNEIIEQEANNDGHIKYYRSDPFEDVFDEVIDSNFVYSERSSFKFGNQPSEGSIVKGNDNFVTFFSDAAFATWSERSSSVSEDSELGTSYQAPEDDLGASLVELQRHARDEPYSGFAISSGWSSTFFPHEVEEEPNNCCWIWQTEMALRCSISGYFSLP